MTIAAKPLKPSVCKPWLKYYSESAIQFELPKATIYRYIYENNKNHRASIAINYFGARISYGKLLDSIDRCASAFSALGVRKGDVICCASVSTPESAYVLYALNKLGASVLTLDPRRSVSELRKFIESASRKVIVVLDLAYEHVCEAMEGLGVENIVVSSVDDSMPLTVRTLKRLKMPAPKIAYNAHTYKWSSFLRLGKGIEVEEAAYGETELAAITLTGGTTGDPKGVMLSNDGFNAVAVDFRMCGVSYSRDQRFLNIIPVFSSYGIVSSLHMPLSLGLEIVMIPKLDPDQLGRLVKKYRPAHTLLVPAHYEKLMNSKEMQNGFDLSFFETAGSGGDTMNAGLERKLNGFLRTHGCKYPLSQGYGMSEVSSAASCCCNGNFKSLSVGYPLLTTTIGIFRPGTTEELGYNEEGEICITGPSVMLGYYNNAAETEKVLIRHPDGNVWVHSGDLGRMDEDGFVFISGRIKRMITRFDGHKIFPTQVEGAIGTHKDVLSCAVVGVRDSLHAQGMMAVAVMELREGCDEKAVQAEVEQICRAELEERGRPADYLFVRQMPRTGMGKIDYGRLVVNYEDSGLPMRKIV